MQSAALTICWAKLCHDLFEPQFPSAPSISLRWCLDADEWTSWYQQCISCMFLNYSFNVTAVCFSLYVYPVVFIQARVLREFSPEEVTANIYTMVDVLLHHIQFEVQRGHLAQVCLSQDKSFLYILCCIKKTYQKLACKHYWYFIYAGLTIQSNHKSFFLYMDTWASSTGYFTASSYWQGWWSLCFTPCGKDSCNFPSFHAMFLKSCRTITVKYEINNDDSSSINLMLSIHVFFIY